VVASTALNELLADTGTGVAHVFRLVRTVTKTGQTSEQVVYGLTALAPAQASAHDLLALVRDHWAIANRLHSRRAVTLREDDGQVRKGKAPRVLAVLKRFLLALLDFLGSPMAPARCAPLMLTPCKPFAFCWVLC
jgi:hypothetical protein